MRRKENYPHQFEKLLIVKQILLVINMRNVKGAL